MFVQRSVITYIKKIVMAIECQFDYLWLKATEIKMN